MGLIEYYLIFSLSTGIACWWLFYYRALQEVQHRGIKNEATQAPVIGSIVYILISTVIAPLLILPLVSKSAGEVFYDSTLSSLLEPDK